MRLLPEHAEGLKLIQILKTAKDVLSAAYGVQAVHAGHAADADTRQTWHVCFTLDYVSNVDLERSFRDPVTRAFVNNFLGPKAERVEMVSFSSEPS